MTVAVRNVPEAGSRGPLEQLSVASLVGVVYIVAALAVVLQLVPALWWDWLGLSRQSFPAWAGLIVAMIAAAAFLAYVGTSLAGPHPPKGMRAGIAVGLVGVAFAGLLTRWASLWFEHWSFDTGSLSRTAAAVLTVVVVVVLLAALGQFYFRPGFQDFLRRFEDQGWFSATSYKPNQGFKVRRGTILGLLILAGSGIWAYERSLRTGAESWTVNIPFTGKVALAEQGDLYRASGVEAPVPTQSGDEQIVDRYALRDANEQLKLKYRVVTAAKETDPFKPGDLVPRAEFDAIRQERADKVERLEAEAKELEEQGNVLEARRREDEAQTLKPLPEASPPAPAEGSVQFASLTVVPAAKLTMPIVLGALALWLAWRIVNLPAFADFLIATEAELNKVSWTTRRRLVQDTIVVLVTVLLFTLYLLLADVFWSQALRLVGVLRKPTDTGEVRTDDTDVPW